ncbi:MAG: transcriptional repressor [Planctomycetota bacterium]
MICLGCGRIEEFRNDAIEELQHKVAESKGYSLHRHLLRLSGYCPECRRSSRRLLRQRSWNNASRADQSTPGRASHAANCGTDRNLVRYVTLFQLRRARRRWKRTAGATPYCTVPRTVVDAAMPNAAVGSGHQACTYHVVPGITRPTTASSSSATHSHR